MPAGGLLLGSIAAPIAGGVIGNLMGAGDRDKAAAARQAALQQMLGIHVPTIDEQKIALAKEGVVGELDPTLQGTVTQDPSAMAGISADPRLRQAQMSALAQMQGLSNTGLSATDREALMKITNQTSGDAEAASKAVMQNMAARGMAGGGAELAARLEGAQAAANRGAAAGQSLAGQAQQKALQAMSNAGALGSQIEGQQFGEEAQKASAADAISRFNAANRQNVIGSNTTAQNTAKTYNLNNAQAVANANTAAANQQEIHNKGLYQTNFDNNYKKAAGAAGQYGEEQKYDTGQADATQKMYAGIGQGVGSGLTGMAAYGKTKAPTDAGLTFGDNEAPQQWTGVAGPETNPNAGAPYPANAPGMAHGGKVQGRAKVSGDSPENDTVETKLSPGEIVVPRSIVNSDDEDVLRDFIKHIKIASKNGK